MICCVTSAVSVAGRRCLDAGASDYIAKPVDIELLLALLRVSVARSREAAAGDGAPRVAAE